MKKILLYLFMLIALVSFTYAQCFFYDNMETGAVADKYTSWTGSSAYVTVPHAYAGTRVMNGTSGGTIVRQYITNSSTIWDTSAQTVFSAWVYVNTSSPYWQSGLEIGNAGAELFQIVYLRSVSTTNWTVFKGSDAPSPINTSVAVTSGWHKIMFNNTHAGKILGYVDGVNVANVTSAVGNRLSTYSDSSTPINAMWDNIMVYNGTESDCTGLAIASFANPTPSDGDRDTNIPPKLLNLSCSVASNASIYLGTANPPTTIVATGTNVLSLVYNTSILSDNTYYYIGRCGITNTTVKSYIIDTISPTITLNPNNFFTTANTTLSTYFDGSNFVRTNISFTDSTGNLYGYEVNFSYTNGTSIFGNRSEALTGASFNYTQPINFTTWTKGQTILVDIWASDSHTNNNIGNYIITKQKKKLIFNTAEKNNIVIETNEDAVTNSVKTANDRYNFEFDFNAKGNNKRIFYVTSDNKLIYINDKYAGHFITYSDKYHGNWIDFEGVGGKITVTKINDYKYMVEVKDAGNSDKMIFNSIGGLNINHVTYSFYLPALPTILKTNITTDYSFPLIDESTLYGYVNNTCNGSCTVLYKWYRSGTEYSNGSYGLTGYFNGTVATLSPSSTSINDTWIFSQKIYDNIYSNATYGTAWSNSTSYSINQIIVDNCSTLTDTTPTLNFTGYYETNLSKVNVDITTGILTFNFGSGNVYNNYFNVMNISSLKFCMYPSWISLNMYYSTTYEQAGSTTIRQRSANIIVNNVTTQIPLYVLSGANSITILIMVVDSTSFPISGVTVSLIKTINGAEYTLQSGTTGDDGVVSLYVDSTSTYSISAVKTGYTTTSKTITSPSNLGTYTLTMGKITNTTQPGTTGLIESFAPSFNVLNSNTSYAFGYNLSSNYWSITSCAVNLYSGNTLLESGIVTSNSSFCSSGFDFNVSSYNNLTLIGTYSLNGTSYTSQNYYIINSYTQGQYSLQTVIDDINAFSGAGFGWQTKMLIAFIIIFIVTALISFKFNSLINPEQSLILQCALVFLFSLIGWLTIPVGMFTFPTVWGTMAGNQFAIFILDLLVTLAYILWRHS